MWNIFRKFHIEKTDDTGIQFYRYFLVGGISFVLDFLLLYVLTNYFEIYYVLSASISFSVGSVLNYCLSIAWIFPQRKISNRVLEFWFFIGIGISGLILNAGIIFGFSNFLKIHYLASKIISAIIVFSWNFAFRKIFLFSIKPTP